MARNPDEEIEDIYDALMEYAKGTSVQEARFIDRNIIYRNMNYDLLVKTYKRTWARCSAEVKAQYDPELFDIAKRGRATRL